MINIGIIGAGHFAKAHIEAIQRLEPRARVILAARRDPATPFAEAEAVGARLVGIPELLESSEIDAVSICTTNDTHRQFTEAALRAGKHVFCEKPLALNRNDAQSVLDIAGLSNRRLLVGHLARHMPVYRAVHDILRGGRLGSVLAAYACRFHLGGDSGRSWRMDPDQGGGVVFDLLIHDIDLLVWYLGKPLSVVAQGRRHAQGGYAHVSSVFEYGNGLVATAEGGFILRPPSGLRSSLRLLCEHGHIEVDTTRKDAPLRVHYEDEGEQEIEVSMNNPLIEGLVSEYAEFLDCIAGSDGGVLSAADACTAVACAEAIIRSADTGERVAIG